MIGYNNESNANDLPTGELVEAGATNERSPMAELDQWVTGERLLEIL